MGIGNQNRNTATAFVLSVSQFLFSSGYSFYVIYFCFSMATVSAVLQPCRTCHMLFVLLARCVVCVLGK